MSVILLHGGPMDGWSVERTAPALRSDWHASLIEAAAAGLYEADRTGLRSIVWPRWRHAKPAVQERYRIRARAQHPPGRYVRAADGRSARWRLS